MVAVVSLIRTAWPRLAGFGSTVLDVVLPPRCLACGDTVMRQGSLCGPCWGGLRFISAPLCACCGLPFEVDPGPESDGSGVLCGACVRRQPTFDSARSVMVYDDGSRDLVLGFKHGDQTHGAPAFAAWLQRVGSGLLAEADLIAPVPLHRWRLVKRRYNQAALLANALGRLGEVPVIPDLLVRRRRTRSQGGLDRDARARNVRAAFAVGRRHAGATAGKRIILVDDVLTTGATVEECAKVLKRAGAAHVGVLTLARVARPQPG